MAGDWLKIEANAPDKPEVIGIADMLGILPQHALGSLFMVWRWFDQHTTQGNAPYVTKVTIDRLSGVTGFADSMEKVGWLLIKDGVISLPNFDRHNGETAKKRGLTAKRVAKHKDKASEESNADANASVTQDALPREEKRREENIKEKPKALSSSPSANIDGSPLDKQKTNKQVNDSARDVLAYLNKNAGKNFRDVDSTLGPIVARLKEGYTAERLREIAFYKIEQWGTDEKMAEYLRPATLYNATKCAQYDGELGS